MSTLGIIPKRQNEKIRIPGRTEEEVQCIYRAKRNAWHRARRARIRNAEKAKSHTPRRMYFSISFCETANPGLMQFRQDLAEICQKHQVKCKETCKPRYADSMVNAQHLCTVEYH
jgi:hypothetical protein